MKITRTFKNVFFLPAVIRGAVSIIEKRSKTAPDGSDEEKRIRVYSLVVERGRDRIEHDNEEQFFADYRQLPGIAIYSKHIGEFSFNLHFHSSWTEVSVASPSADTLHEVLNYLEEAIESSRLPEPPVEPPQPLAKPKIFIGHGRSGMWRELKDHLTDKHGLEVVAYEVGARAGHAIRDILEDMLTTSSMGVLVLTGEDRDENGSMHARENVIHETGLFQGRIGFSRSIVALENGTVEFSNIHGIDQLRFSKGNIKEIFGDVVAVIRREFGE